MQKEALYTAALIFAALALAHLVRYFLETELVFGGVVIPVLPSLPIGIVLGALAVWMFLAGRRS